jgi:hypothetical protein
LVNAAWTGFDASLVFSGTPHFLDDSFQLKPMGKTYHKMQVAYNNFINFKKMKYFQFGRLKYACVLEK